MTYLKWNLFPVFLVAILTSAALWGCALGILYFGRWALRGIPLWLSGIGLAVALVCLSVAMALDYRYSRAKIMRQRLNRERMPL